MNGYAVGVAFFLGFFGWMIALAITKPSIEIQTPREAAEMQCVKNNGIPVEDSWGSLTSCKIYITPTPKVSIDKNTK